MCFGVDATAFRDSQLWQKVPAIKDSSSLEIFTESRRHFKKVFTTEGFLEVAIESWTEWDLNPRPLNSVQTL